MSEDRVHPQVKSRENPRLPGESTEDYIERCRLQYLEAWFKARADEGGPRPPEGAEQEVGPLSARSQAPSLVIYGHVGTGATWTRQQRRIYQRVNSVLCYWEQHNFQVLWVMLSTAVGGPSEKLSYHHKVLRQKIERKYGFKGMQHFQVETREGNGVLHVLWAWKPRDGERQRNFSVPQVWLSEEWERIHGASYVYICRYGRGRRSKKRVSRYVVTQYCAEQVGLVRCSWSWKRTFGFPLVKVWGQFKSLYRGPLYRGAIPMWETLMRGEKVMVGGGGIITLEGLRAKFSSG